jgi:N-acyl-D-amino-acid deacylase
MSPNPKKLSRRALLASFGGLALSGISKALAQVPNPLVPFEEEAPINGKAGPGLEAVDTAVIKIMDRHGIPGAALAIAKNGKLVLAKGYGWSDVAMGTAVGPNTPFGLASVSKVFTATAILKLVENGRLGLDDKVLGHVKDIKPPFGRAPDPLLGEVTVRHCLNHSGGWDRTVEGDPITWQPLVCRAMRVRPPLSAAQLLSFVFGLPLNFKPGTEVNYSNVGFVILGEIISRVSGQSYERFVAENVLKPLGLKRPALHPIEGKYLEHESIRYMPGALIALPPMRMPMLNACGGWSASVVDMLRFLTNIDGSRGEAILKEKTRKEMFAKPDKSLVRPDGTWFGLGWDSVHFDGDKFSLSKEGNFQGMRTFLKHQPSGVDLALLFNVGMEFDPLDVRITALAIREVKQALERVEKYPDIDLFEEF